MKILQESNMDEVIQCSKVGFQRTWPQPISASLQSLGEANHRRFSSIEASTRTARGRNQMYSSTTAQTGGSFQQQQLCL